MKLRGRGRICETGRFYAENERMRDGWAEWWIEKGKSDGWRNRWVGIKVRPDTAKLTNVIVTGVGEWCNLVSESKMFVKHEAKVSSRVGGVKWRVGYFRKLVFESDDQEFSLRGVKSKKISKSCYRKQIAWMNADRRQEPRLARYVGCLSVRPSLARSATRACVCVSTETRSWPLPWRNR